MSRKWGVLVALVFLAVVGWVVATPPKMYSIDEVRAVLAGDLESGWVMKSEKTIFTRPYRNYFQKHLNRIVGIYSTAYTGSRFYEFSNGAEMTVMVVYFDANILESVSFAKSVYAEELKDQIQKKLPGIQCRIDSP